jgi:hypothetical protein
MIKILILMITLTACSSLRDQPISDSEFVIRESNSTRPTEFNK